MIVLDDHVASYFIVAVLRVGLPIVFAAIISVVLVNGLGRKAKRKHKKSPCKNKGNQHKAN